MSINIRDFNTVSTVIYGTMAMLFVLALVITLNRGSLVSAAQTDLKSAYVTQELPIGDPESPLWDSAPAAEVPLSGQNITAPFNIDATIDTIRIRSLHNGKWIAFQMEWDDASKDLGGGSNDYRDSVALQFPVHGGEPFVCMGFVDSEVNILHWRADFQRNIEDGPLSITDIFPNADANTYPLATDITFTSGRATGNPISASEKRSPVEDLTASGFGTLESQEQVDVTGWGAWDGDKWSVVIARPLVTSDLLDTQFEVGEEAPVALAVWNGDNQEVDGKKSVSAWVNVALDDIPGAAGPSGDGDTVGNVPDQSVIATIEAYDPNNILIFAVAAIAISIASLMFIIPAILLVGVWRRREV